MECWPTRLAALALAPPISWGISIFVPVESSESFVIMFPFGIWVGWIVPVAVWSSMSSSKSVVSRRSRVSSSDVDFCFIQMPAHRHTCSRALHLALLSRYTRNSSGPDHFHGAVNSLFSLFGLVLRGKLCTFSFLVLSGSQQGLAMCVTGCWLESTRKSRKRAENYWKKNIRRGAQCDEGKRVKREKQKTEKLATKSTTKIN